MEPLQPIGISATDPRPTARGVPPPHPAHGRAASACPRRRPLPASSAVTSWPTRRRARRSSRRTSTPRRRAGRAARRAPERPLRRHQADRRPAQGHQRRPRRGQGQDRRTWKPRSMVIKADYNSLVAAAQDARRPARRHRGARDGQADRARRAQGAPRRPPPERLRHRPDLAPRIVPVGRHVHRPAGRDELLHRRRRAGQGARQPGRQGPGDARRAPPDDDRRAVADRRPAPADGRLEARARQEPRRAQGRQGRRSRSSRSGSPRRSPSRSATTPSWRQNKAAAKTAIAKASAAQKKLKGQIAALIRKQMQGGNIPSQYNGTLSWPMAGDVTQNFGCTGFSWEPPRGVCDHFHNGIDMVAPVRHAGEGVRLRDGRLHRLELRRRRGPGLDRHHRPQRGPPDLVRPHAAALPERDPRRQPRSAAASSSATRATPATRPGRTSTGRSCSTGTSSTRGCSCRRGRVGRSAGDRTRPGTNGNRPMMFGRDRPC